MVEFRHNVNVVLSDEKAVGWGLGSLWILLPQCEDFDTIN